MCFMLLNEVNIDSFNFRGLEKSHIFFECVREEECTYGKWILQSVLEPKMILETQDEFPIGTNEWELGADDALCHQLKGYKQILTLSQCYPDKFTCSSGHCIPLEDRCNVDYDCIDFSDEKNCQAIQMNDDYIKELLPVSKNQEPCIVHINVTISSFPEISTKQVKFTSDFFLNLRWNDLRLSFWDLDHDFVRNIISKQDLHNIWHPTLMFTNSLGSQNPIDDKAGIILRNKDPIEEDILLTPEGRKDWIYIVGSNLYKHFWHFLTAHVFPGDQNSIYTSQRYLQEFVCHFDLTYYPFDNQVSI